MALRFLLEGRVITSYSIHYTKLYEGKSNGSGSALGTIRPSRRKRKAILFEADTANITYSLADFQTAVEKTIDELKDLQDKFASSLPESESLIFTAHFMMLKDKNFTGKMKTLFEMGLGVRNNFV